MDSYKNKIVDKPWGYEYLIYENDLVALWLLHIKPNQKTSLHCHPKKTTGLVLLSGKAELSFLADKKIINSPDKQMLRRGLFHQTKSLSEDGIIVLEIETPNDKGDLIRLKDSYGRENKGYEKSNYEREKNIECIWINEPKENESRTYKVKDKLIEVYSVTSKDFLKKMNDTDIVMFLNGGLGKNVDGKERLATMPGDVGRAAVIKKVAEEMDYVSKNTLVLKIAG